MTVKFLSFLLIASLSFAQQINIKIIETTDSHGAIYPYDFLTNSELSYSLANVNTYLKQERRDTSQEVILLSNGDILQGTPAVYYYNFEGTASTHLYAKVMNYMNYDAGTVGNHDIEAGHAVYDRFEKELNFPWLAANAVKNDGIIPYFEPYTVIERAGLKIAVLGLITPYIPYWLPEKLYSGMEFNDMIESAEYWVDIIQKKEKPDLLIGLFHSGVDYTQDAQDENTYKNENASLLVAQKVAGFDAVFVGHDHHGWNKIISNSEGKNVLLLGGTYSAKDFAVAEFTVDTSAGNNVVGARGYLINSKNYEPDNEFLNKFSAQFEKVKEYVSRPLGKFNQTISTRESFFGDSPFIDLIHNMQLEISGAQISFSAPLSYDTQITEGNVYVRDMFKLYRYENLLYTMKLYGSEIDAVLEYSCAGWFNLMKNENDHLLNFVEDDKGNLVISKYHNAPMLKQRFYNFESAEGIIYTVDVSKPSGERVNIISFNDGSPFYTDSLYTVAMSSYRGNGGGGHLTSGAGISRDDLSARLVKSTDKDLRFYLMKNIEKKKTITINTNHNWKIIPEGWAKKAAERDYKLMFGNEK